MRKSILLICICAISMVLNAETGAKLWLRADVNNHATVKANKQSPTIDVAIEELQSQWKGKPIQLVIGRVKALLQSSPDSYIIRSHGTDDVYIESTTDRGVLYGAYHLLRLQETGQAKQELQIVEQPKHDLRILNHWDNLDRTVERGYAGYSLWKWDELPETISPRYKEYARANASIGINATVLNNVNASPDILNADYLKKVKAIAGIFRPYGIKVYLSVNFSSPKVLGGLENSDPLNPAVRKWWKDKIKEVYTIIPDFGGFLVKANSEGQPGPQDYGRTHADGANMLADVLKPYKGIVMWRAFVYNPSDEDRAKQACLEFVPLDGQFRDNVIVQIKNGPIDFQPREPFNPLFGAMKQTAQMLEFQITQEYLGFSNHLVYLAPLFKETLDSDTYAYGEGSTIAKITDGTLHKQKLTAISAVANIGDDINWCGHHFAQANWYAFGRLAWNHQLSSEQIAEEWLKMTFTDKDKFVNPAKEIMLLSREAAVDYMMPLGLHHIFAWNHHYGPEPWCNIPDARPDWLPPYYHNADSVGLGFNRTATGSNAISQYFPPLNDIYGSTTTCPENLILWFHHLPWDYRMSNGNSLWDELCYVYDRGVQQTRTFQQVWDSLEEYIDKPRFQDIQRKLKIQSRDAIWWKDGCLLYFQEFSRRPIPSDIERPIHDLERMKQFRLDISNHENVQENDLFMK